VSTAVITIVSGRHQHLLNQQRGLRSGTRLPEHYVVVAMDDSAALRLTGSGPLAGAAPTIHQMSISVGRGLPLAAARNLGATTALAAGAETLIFLDVDCVPSPSLVEMYSAAVAAEQVPALHCGVVRYLGAEVDAGAVPAGELSGPAHPARPNPEAGRAISSQDWRLFWSLSFAVSSRTWRELGGFHEGYVGYGGEDTDLGYRAFRKGLPLRWLGGADAFHQYHPTERPPVRHLADIIDNATIFHRRWGFWPMQGWLDAFAELGLASYDATGDRWLRAG
jgi:hypothetical protein